MSRVQKKTELSKIVFLGNPKVYTSKLVVDDYSIGETFGGVLIKPGKHTLSYQTRYEEGGCTLEQRRNRGFFEDAKCFERKKSCSGTFASQKGQDYKVEVTYEGAIITRVSDGERVGSAACESLQDRPLY